MTTRIKRVITTIADDGTAVAEAHPEYQRSGQWWPDDPVPLATAGPEWDAWKQTFNAAAIAERDQLLADKSSLESQVATLTTERDEALASLASVTSERNETQSQVEALTIAVGTLTTERDQATAELLAAQSTVQSQAAQIEQLQAELDALLNPPVNPRHLAPFDFLALLKPTEVYALQTSSDPMVVVARAKLQTIMTYVDLDHPDTIELANYMESQGLLEAGRAAQILAAEPPTA